MSISAFRLSLDEGVVTRAPNQPLPVAKPGKKPLSTAAYALAMRRSLIHGFDETSYRQPVTIRRIPGLTITLVNSPDGIRHVAVENAGNYIKSPITLPLVGLALGDGLVTSEGAPWRHDRKLMAPSFEARVVSSYAPHVTDALRRSVGRLSEAARAGRCVHLKAEMMALTLDIISASMFSGDGARLGPTMDAASRRYQNEISLHPAILIPGVRKVWWKIKQGRARTILRELDEQMFSLIRERRKRNDAAAASADLLDRLLSARDETGGMSDKLIRDQMVTIFVAGHETTALALMWSLLLLAAHPAALKRAQDEVASVLQGAAPNYGHIKDLVCLRNVFQEALRLYPPAHSMAWRTPLRDDVIDGTPVKAGSIVAIIPWVVHRHHLYWDNPDCFDPDRFLQARSKERSRHSYIPFGAGARVCIGAAFAMMAGIMSLAGLLQGFAFKPLRFDGLEPLGLITLHPAEEPIVTVLPRT